jgi:hypothetical protein
VTRSSRERAIELVARTRPGQSLVAAVRSGKRRARPYVLRGRIRHVHGQRKVAYGPDELLLITVVRNGELYVRSFMEHYLSLGIGHAVFLDNGSTDRTVEMLREYAPVTVLTTDAPYREYENLMKRYLAQRFSRGRWNLCADIDELFDYPFSDAMSLRAFLQYLNEKRYTAVVSQMLDMFADAPLDDLESSMDDRISDKYPYYDISSIRQTDYTWSKPAHQDIKWLWGGIRKAAFGSDNSLTKAALTKVDGSELFVGWHHVVNARVADVSCVLKHYPFVSSFATKVHDAVGTQRYGNVTTDEYLAYARALERHPRLNLRTRNARRLRNTEELIEAGFLVVSDDYREWVRDHGRSGRGHLLSST